MVTITKTPAPILTKLTQTFCEIDLPTVVGLDDDGATGPVVWYTAATGGTALDPATALADGTYYAAQTVNGCERLLRTAVTVTITKITSQVLTELTQSFFE